MDGDKAINDLFVANAGRRWTQQEIDLVKSRLEATRTDAEWNMAIDGLAQKLGRTNKAVISLANKTIGKKPQVRKGQFVRIENQEWPPRRIHVYPVNRGRIREALTCLAMGGGLGYIFGVASALFYLG